MDLEGVKSEGEEKKMLDDLTHVWFVNKAKEKIISNKSKALDFDKIIDVINWCGSWEEV